MYLCFQQLQPGFCIFFLQLKIALFFHMPVLHQFDSSCQAADRNGAS